MRSSIVRPILTVLVSVLGPTFVLFKFFAWASLYDFRNRGCWDMSMEEWDYTSNCWDGWNIGLYGLLAALVCAIGLVICVRFNGSRNRYHVLLWAVGVPAFMLATIVLFGAISNLVRLSCRFGSDELNVNGQCGRIWSEASALATFVVLLIIGLGRSAILLNREKRSSENNG